MRIEQIQYLVEIADSGSISTAAEKLHISQPNISKSLAGLENELQTKIFKRSRIGVKPTESGQLIIEQAREILLQLDKLKKISQTQSSSIIGSLSVAAIPSFIMSFLPLTLREFTNEYPGVHIELIDAGSLRIKDYVVEAKVDFGLVAFFESVELDDKLVFEPLLSGRSMVCVGKNSELAHKKQISLQELIDYPIITFSSEYSMNSFVLNFLNQYGKPNLLSTSGNSEASKKIIAQGIAVGVYSEISLKTDPYVLTGEIIPLHISNPETNAHFGILHRKDVKLSIQSVELIKGLRIQAKEFSKLYNLTDHNLVL